MLKYFLLVIWSICLFVTKLDKTEQIYYLDYPPVTAIWSSNNGYLKVQLEEFKEKDKSIIERNTAIDRVAYASPLVEQVDESPNGLFVSVQTAGIITKGKFPKFPKNNEQWTMNNEPWW